MKCRVVDYGEMPGGSYGLYGPTWGIVRIWAVVCDDGHIYHFASRAIARRVKKMLEKNQTYYARDRYGRILIGPVSRLDAQLAAEPYDDVYSDVGRAIASAEVRSGR